MFTESLVMRRWCRAIACDGAVCCACERTLVRCAAVAGYGDQCVRGTPTRVVVALLCFRCSHAPLCVCGTAVRRSLLTVLSTRGAVDVSRVLSMLTRCVWVWQCVARRRVHRCCDVDEPRAKSTVSHTTRVDSESVHSLLTRFLVNHC